MSRGEVFTRQKLQEYLDLAIGENAKINFLELVEELPEGKQRFKTILTEQKIDALVVDLIQKVFEYLTTVVPEVGQKMPITLLASILDDGALLRSFRFRARLLGLKRPEQDKMIAIFKRSIFSMLNSKDLLKLEEVVDGYNPNSLIAWSHAK